MASVAVSTGAGTGGDSESLDRTADSRLPASPSSPQSGGEVSDSEGLDGGGTDQEDEGGAGGILARKGRRAERPTRIRHNKVDRETGEVAYKKVKSSTLQDAIQLGIRISLSNTGQQKRRDLLQTDFNVVETLSFLRFVFSACAGLFCSCVSRVRRLTVSLDRSWALP